MICITLQNLLDKLKDYYPGLSKIKLDPAYGNSLVQGIENDSRKVREGVIFVAIKGYKIDGHQFVDSAIKRGALAVFVDESDGASLGQMTGSPVPIITFSNTRRALAVSARVLFDNPSGKLKLIGITGTNGKTTITYLLQSIFKKANKKVGLIGTICNYINDEKIKSPVTTPDSLELNRLFQEMLDKGVGYVVMEVSSHALYLDRVAGMDFDAVIFTNLSADHLDFHGTMDEYLSVKQQILDVLNESAKNSRLAVINGDLEISDGFVHKAERLNLDYVTYGFKAENTFQATDISYSLSGSTFTACYSNSKTDIQLPMPGGFNVYNALASIAIADFLGIGNNDISSGLKDVTVPGRFQSVKTAIGAHIIIDYAHTDDAIRNVLSTLRELNPSRVISVFGCGGDRDRSKRPLMGAVSGAMSDLTIVTSDNPRTEEPDRIINEIISGVNKVKGQYLKVENRFDAIKQAIELSHPGDAILIAGKGHEDYQILRDKTIHFDDKEVVDTVLRSLYG